MSCTCIVCTLTVAWKQHIATWTGVESSSDKYVEYKCLGVLVLIWSRITYFYVKR